jgi:hypothetical protein
LSEIACYRQLNHRADLTEPLHWEQNRRTIG